MSNSQDSFTFTVGKLDAGMAILLGERAHLIEFPSVLLPPGATTGSIVNIAVHQNHGEEKRRDAEFWMLQQKIVDAFGVEIPTTPNLQLRNVTQTSVTLEWPPLQLTTAKLRSLDIYRNGQRLASIPSPMTNTSTKLSGLDINSEYTLQLILRTTAGTYPSNIIRVRTHTMTDTSGISVCFGNVQDEVLLENAKMALSEMGARWSDKIQIDTTHFICTTPAATTDGAEASGNTIGAPGVEYQRALQLSIPVATPHWILACHSEKKMVTIAQYYLGADPPANASTHTFRPQSMSSPNKTSQAESGSKPHSPSRASMPPPARNTSPTNSTFVGQPQSPSSTPRDSQSDTTPGRTLASQPIAEEPTKTKRADAEGEDVDLTSSEATVTSTASKRKSRAGTMNRDFKFPSPTSSPVTSQHPLPLSSAGNAKESKSPPPDPIERAVTPSSIEVPPPPPVEKERNNGHEDDDGDDDDDLGSIVDIPLN